MEKEIKIGIIGEFRSGKNTVADYLTDNYGFVQFAFATELKNGFHREYPHIPALPKPREGYQMYGELKRYVYGKDYWINITLDEIKTAKYDGERLGYIDPEIGFRPVVTDVRHPNEWETLKAEGYYLIKVIIPTHVRLARAEAAGDVFSPESLNHVSEKHVQSAPCDYLISNDGTFEELYERIDEIMADIEGKNNDKKVL
jgi:dephospho-CoA kinase